jgi:hypothetical protein
MLELIDRRQKGSTHSPEESPQRKTIRNGKQPLFQQQLEM